MTDARPEPQSIDDYIRELVDTFPPLTEVQRSAIAALLRPEASPAPRTARAPGEIPAPRRSAA
ncbi:MULTISPECIES: hypothetical protein [Pseudonocardia]|uniref:Uncharacterized protein n=2 Tax=Pseudonocardia TaxID=1847 RepID=A0A1Y2N297_PSEAH|nr:MULTISPECIES: hypothetical protein [Pseudonocardia]OSY41028.1 hypothetical protein BG845_02370 [Pseudonocardia autotrophica]TDN73845.1 hypothetical protein C8E95_2952 [Pseudonocardia autotrophica]BBG04593.1 hypothetical protein Pdca_58020 [Pseudonocardia autotrophica]GEC25705.1 hypothetical protein PSA01_27340 [Pseudonocardia saturnea]